MNLQILSLSEEVMRDRRAEFARSAVRAGEPGREPHSHRVRQTIKQMMLRLQGEPDHFAARPC
jgi:hypothetical protein